MRFIQFSHISHVSRVSPRLLLSRYTFADSALSFRFLLFSFTGRMCSSDSGGLVGLEECRRFVVDCMRAVQTPAAHAEQLAELLVDADYRGHYSHGMNRLGEDVNFILGLCRCFNRM